MLFRSTLREIKNSLGRYIAILAIIALGVGFFAGLKVCRDDMISTADDYLNESRFFDYQLMSTLGYDEDSVDCVAEALTDAVIEGYDSYDVLVAADDSDLVYKALSISENINKPELLAGRMPQSADECLIDKQAVDMGDGSVDGVIGSVVTISKENSEDTANAFKYDEYKVVGVAASPLYMNYERGTASIGDGSVSAFFYILPEGFDTDYFTGIYIDADIPGLIYSDEYNDGVDALEDDVTKAAEEAADLRRENIVDDARKELEEGRAEYEDGLARYNAEKADAEARLQSALADIVSGEQEIENNRASLKNQRTELQASLEDINAGYAGIDQQQAQLDASKDYMSPEEAAAAQAQIDAARSQLDSSKAQVQSGLQQIESGLAQLDSAEADLAAGRAEYNSSKAEADRKFAEARAELDDAAKELEKAERDIEDIENPEVYVLNRESNVGYLCFDSDSQIVDSIAAIFPIFFFLVAALVCMTTMTRMVEEQRSQSGTLRALGYSKWDVMKQYIIYVIFATFFACILGIVSGTQFFPRIIYYLYNLMLFQVDAPISIYASTWVLLETVFISVFVILAVTLFVCMSELNLMPAVLMRPKAPKVGKRILLERIHWLWRRLSFNQKVTMRNIFRYKKRFFMSVIGIAGCTALIITGFGVKSSVSQVVDKQYQDVFTYDYLVRLEDSVSTKTAQNYQKDLLNRSEVANVEYVLNKSINILKDKEDLYGSLIVYQSMDNMKNFVQFRNYQTYKDLVLDDEGVILTAKAAELLGVEDNDTIDIELNETKYSVKVSGITENYFMNYIYMSQTLYESLTLQDLEVNNAFLILQDDRASSRKTLEAYMQDKGYGNLTNVSSIGEEFDKQVQSVNLVVIILIVCAGALNFIVLYNLTNINIQERKSEIATIKVLGFRRKEVYDYIFRENVLLSVIGSLLGMIFGYFLHKFIILTVELDMTMFVRQLNISSYIYAIIMTLGFTYFINFTMRHVLNKVDMVESLKSIE